MEPTYIVILIFHIQEDIHNSKNDSICLKELFNEFSSKSYKYYCWKRCQLRFHSNADSTFIRFLVENV